jgi:hypothetical protein
MKTVQDWGFISKDQGLVKPKLQDNKIFHALTSAYENNQQHEIYGATENIIRREKELCELALADLKKLSEGKGEGDATLKLVLDHYQARLQVAREKQEKINQLSEDSRKMTEEYKKKTQELADVKRSLMDSQSKLRELAKTTEKLLKREEELRFIETNLRTELDKNKRNHKRPLRDRGRSARSGSAACLARSGGGRRPTGQGGPASRRILRLRPVPFGHGSLRTGQGGDLPCARRAQPAYRHRPGASSGRDGAGGGEFLDAPGARRS